MHFKQFNLIKFNLKNKASLSKNIQILTRE